MADNLAEKLFGGLAETVKESLSNAPREIGAELKYQVGAGAHELAAALFNGSPFVMYPRGGKDDHGVHGPETPEMTKDGPEKSKGMSM
jgi:hypothetical protein